MSNPYSPPQASLDKTMPPDVEVALWNPNAAAAWSLLFSPIFGAILHMKNWEALGKQEEAAKSKAWAIGSVVMYVAIFIVSFMAPESKTLDGITRAAGFALLIAWYFACARDQAQFIDFAYQKNYVRRGLGKPLLFALLAFAGVMVLAVIVAVIVATVTGEA